MTFTVIAVVLGFALIVRACGHGTRIEGVSWFEIAHEMRGTSKKARGRMQQRKHHR